MAAAMAQSGFAGMMHCVMLFFMLSFKITVVVRGNSVVALIWIAQGMSFTLTICMVSLLTLILPCTIPYRILYEVSLLCVLAGVAAMRGEVEKDAHYEEAALGAGGLWRDSGPLVSC